MCTLCDCSNMVNQFLVAYKNPILFFPFLPQHHASHTAIELPSLSLLSGSWSASIPLLLSARSLSHSFPIMSSRQPLSPRSQKGKRRSLIDAFPNLQIESSSGPAGKENAFGAKGSFSRGWPPLSESMRAKLSSSQSGYDIITFLFLTSSQIF